VLAEKFSGEPTEKRLKNSTIKPFPGRGGGMKKDQKIALLSLCLLHLYHV